jgi:hypothetical protein
VSAPRRRIVRPNLNQNGQQQRRLQLIRERLERERASLIRWQKRLRRAFTTVERLHKQIDRLERRRSQLEGGI